MNDVGSLRIDNDREFPRADLGGYFDYPGTHFLSLGS